MIRSVPSLDGPVAGCLAEEIAGRAVVAVGAGVKAARSGAGRGPPRRRLNGATIRSPFGAGGFRRRRLERALRPGGRLLLKEVDTKPRYKFYRCVLQEAVSRATEVWQHCEPLRATREKEFRYHVVKLKLLVASAHQLLDTFSEARLSQAA